MVAVIDAAGGSMLASKLPAAYEAKYGRPLDFKALGFASMSALAPRIPGVGVRNGHSPATTVLTVDAFRDGAIATEVEAPHSGARRRRRRRPSRCITAAALQALRPETRLQGPGLRTTARPPRPTCPAGLPPATVTKWKPPDPPRAAPGADPAAARPRARRRRPRRRGASRATPGVPARVAGAVGARVCAAADSAAAARIRARLRAAAASVLNNAGSVPMFSCAAAAAARPCGPPILMDRAVSCRSEEGGHAAPAPNQPEPDNEGHGTPCQETFVKQNLVPKKSKRELHRRRQQRRHGPPRGRTGHFVDVIASDDLDGASRGPHQNTVFRVTERRASTAPSTTLTSAASRAAASEPQAAASTRAWRATARGASAGLGASRKAPGAGVF